MSSSFEEILLAIAVKNRIITHEIAVECLAAFKARAGREDIGIYDVLIERKLITQAQAEVLAGAAKKVMASQSTQKMAAAKGPAPPGPQDPREPIPGYRIVGKLGVGGTATVFLAESRRQGGRQVALKILHPAKARDEKALASFVREAELLVKFDHANLVKGYDSGRMGPLAYVAMEYLEGESVQDAIERDGHLAEARALEIILETAKALEYTQQQGIVHRDIKPGNIMVLKDGHIKLCDLGFALPIGSQMPGGEEETTSGTVQYMSPEQARGQSDIDVRADIYSLGASLYHMVMGELPFSGGDSLEVMAKQVMEALNSTEIKNRRISRHMHYFIERMMSKEKDLRYSTPRDLIDDINEQIEGFRSLEYHAEDEVAKSTNVMKGLSNDPTKPPTARHKAQRRLRPPP